MHQVSVDGKEISKNAYNGFTVSKANGQVQLEEWPKGRTLFNARDWLDCYGCLEAEWRDPTQFF